MDNNEELQTTPEEIKNTDSLLNMATDDKSKPEFLSDDLWDSEKNEVKVQDLMKAYESEQKKAKGLREKLSKGVDKAPEKIEDYAFNEGIELSDDDALFIKEAAKEAGFTNDQLNGFLSKVSERYGVDEKPVDQAEVMREEMKKLGDSAPQILRAVADFKNGLLSQGVINEEQAKTIEKMAINAESVEMLNIFRTLIGGESVPVKSMYSDGLPSDAEIFAMMGTEEYQKGNPEALRKVDELMSKRERAGRPTYLQL